MDVPVGTSVMRGAVDNNVPGIDADCGGECACATCHVYVDAAWLPKIGTPVPGSQEAAMLSFAAVAQPDSRLSCQITMTEDSTDCWSACRKDSTESAERERAFRTLPCMANGKDERS